MIKRMYSHKKKAATAALCAAFALFSTASVLAAEPADVMGKTITAVKIEGETAVAEADVYSVLKLHPGDTAETTALQTDLKAVYDMGYFYNASIEFQEVPEGVEVIYLLEENPKLQTVAFEGNISATQEELDALITNPRGEVINTKLLAQNTKQIEAFYHDKGFILTKVTDVNMEPDGTLRVKINEGILEGFTVKGNEKTKDNVILREMRMKPGEPFNVKDAQRSVQRINNLGFFEDVNVKLNPGKEPNAVVLETSVIEQRTGMFSIGGGYSDSDGVVGIIQLGDRNFLGRGDDANILWEFGGDADEYKNYEVSYKHPWFDEKETTIGGSFYDRTTEYDDYDTGGHRRSTYDKNRKGLDIYFSRPQTEYSTNYLTLRAREDTYEEHAGGKVNYSKPAGPGMGDAHNKFMSKYPNYIDDNFGRTHSAIFSHVTDTRDNVFNPMEGHRASMTAEFAGGPIGGDFDYQKFSVEDRRYYKVGRAHVIALRGSVGYAMGDMPESSQFSLGGVDTLRGFEDEQFQGSKMYMFNAEYRFPIAKKLQGVLFADTGNAWDGIIDDDNDGLSEINYGYGIGIRFQSPLGPIKLDFGKGNSGGGFKTHFSFAGQF